MAGEGLKTLEGKLQTKLPQAPIAIITVIIQAILSMLGMCPTPPTPATLRQRFGGVARLAIFITAEDSTIGLIDALQYSRTAHTVLSEATTEEKAAFIADCQ